MKINDIPRSIQSFALSNMLKTGFVAVPIEYKANQITINGILEDVSEQDNTAVLKLAASQNADTLSMRRLLLASRIKEMTIDIGNNIKIEFKKEKCTPEYLTNAAEKLGGLPSAVIDVLMDYFNMLNLLALYFAGRIDEEGNPKEPWTPIENIKKK